MRIWKSDASKKLGPVSTKERQAIEYRQKLVERYGREKGVREVKERRHVPQSIHNATKLKREMIEARNIKEDRRRKHSRAGREKPKAERKSKFVVMMVGRVLMLCRNCGCGAAVVGAWYIRCVSIGVMYVHCIWRGVRI